MKKIIKQGIKLQKSARTYFYITDTKTEYIGLKIFIFEKDKKIIYHQIF